MNLLLTLYVFCSVAFADSKRLAVLEFRGVGAEQTVLLKLSDQARIGAVGVLPDDYQVMTRESMLEILKDMGKDATCLEGECETKCFKSASSPLDVTKYYTLVL